MRMLMNNLDPEVAERPEDLVVYGGTGRAAREWEAYDAIVTELRGLKGDQTLLVQSGKPVGVFDTHEWAPRVLISNSMLVPQWATWEEFRRLEALGLTMYGQMTAGSWIYIGTQGILQGTYETFAAIARKRFHDSLAGTITLTAGLGGMGGAQPLAVTLNGGVAICVEVDPERMQRRLDHRYLDVRADDVEHALRLALAAARGLSTIRVLCRRTSGPCSARARAHFDGLRFRATRLTSRLPTARSSTSSRTIRRSCAGSKPRANVSGFKGCPRASVGSATVSGPAPAIGSTSSCARARSKRRS